MDQAQARPELPAELAREVFSDFRPVRPVLRAEARAAVVSALAVAAAVLLLATFGVRHDISQLPKDAFLSVLMVRIAAGLSLILLALREAIPSAGTSGRWRTISVVTGIAMLIVLPELFSFLSGAARNDIAIGPFFCFPLIIAVAVPSFAGLVALLGRAYPLRPVLTGFLAGLGSGILAEAAQFIVCSNRDPAHGVAVHGTAAIAVALAGALAGRFIRRSRRPLRSELA